MIGEIPVTSLSCGNGFEKYRKNWTRIHYLNGFLEMDILP